MSINKSSFLYFVKRIALTTIFGVMLSTLAVAGTNAAGFSFLDSVKDFFGMQPSQERALPEPLAPAETLTNARSGHTATLLADGKVLFTGGDETGSAEIYDLVTGQFVPTGNLGTARSGHTATLLADGRVLCRPSPCWPCLGPR